MATETKKEIPLFKVFMPESVMEPLKRTLLSGYIGQGPKVEEFEQALAQKLGTSHILTLNSGTAGLQLALRLAGVGPGDEVITTALTCTATNWPILAQGGIPVWADIDPKTTNIDPKSIESLVTSKTKAIIAVHWGGYPCDMEAIWAIAKKHNLKVVEDCAHSFGSTYKNVPVGTQSDFGIYSFQAIKHMTTVDGGILIVKDESLYKKGKLLRWYGIDRETPRADFRCENDVLEWGYKFHMNDVNATIGIEQLKYVDATIAKHRENAAFFTKELKGVKGVTLLEEKNDRKSAYWLYTIKVTERDRFITTMKERGIMTSRVHERNDKHTTVAPYKRPLPVLDQFIGEMVCIPVGWWVSIEERQYIVDSIKKGWTTPYMKTALVLSTAFITTLPSSPTREERIKQYVAGFKQVAELVKKHPEFDVFSVDNTVEDESKLDPRLLTALNQIPNLKKHYYFYDNEYGKKNKGAGLIVQWRKILEYISPEYEYVVHYEPRQRLESFAFFERFLASPGAYFKLSRDRVKKFRVFPYTLVQILTGLIAIKRADLENYATNVNIPFMVLERKNIERSLYLFVRRKNVKHTLLDMLNLLWHDTATNTMIKF